MKLSNGEILDGQAARILKWVSFSVLLIAAMVIAIGLSTSTALAVDAVIPPGCTGCHETQGLADTPQTLDCVAGACHATTNFTQTSGSHRTHLNAASGTGGIGPDAMVCDVCHGTNATTAEHAGHLNGIVNFTSASERLSTTPVCATCHSPGGGYNGVDSTGSSVGAKDNWASGVYSGVSTLSLNKEKWCVGCHDDDGPTLNGRQAPNVGGDGSIYGFFVSGHGLDSGSLYDGVSVGSTVDGNDGAGKDCSDCHEFQYDHIDPLGIDNTGTVDQRLKDDINSRTVTTVDDVCRNCHSVDGVTPNGDPPLDVSSHGNADSTSTGGANDYDSIEPDTFSVQCPRCHDPHSGKLNTDLTRNLNMVRPDVIISESLGTTGNVVFTSEGDDGPPGINSYDETDTEESDTGTPQEINEANNSDDICTTCHSNSDNPGYPMTDHAGGFGHEGGSLDNRGKKCTACHPHYYGGLLDTTYSIDDGFMPDALFCGACHPATMATMNTGSHQTHFRSYYTTSTTEFAADSLKGPGILICDVCHGLDSGDIFGSIETDHHEGHQNQKVNFDESSETVLATSSTGYTGTVTSVCNSCHSPGGSYNGVDTTDTPALSVGAKDNWSAGVYDDSRTLSNNMETWCVGCHDETPSVITGVADDVSATDTPTSTMTAANMAGNDTTYGAFASGHNKTTASGSYDETTTMAGGNGNAAANKGCDTCHDLGVQHLNRSNDTSMAGQRITEVNGVTIAANAAPSEVCKACHQNTGGTPALNQVSDHGNIGEGYVPIESTITPVVSCDTCHEGHGLNENTNGVRNLRMVRNAIEVTTTPPTTTSIVFERTTGTDSLDESDAVDSDDVCAACHSSGVNSGTPMTRHDGGDHTTADTSSIFYNNPDADKRGTLCTACHEHNYKEGEDGDIVTDANAFMPRASASSCLAGEACHAATIGDQVSGSHDTHFPSSAIGPGLLTCDACHGINASPNGQHAGHSNGTVNFQENATSTLSNTSVCDTCHSSGGGYDGVDDTTSGAKNNWTDGVYVSAGTTLTAGKETWCVGCHDASPSQINISGTTMTAPAAGGDASAYGFYVSGHGLDSGSSYDATSTGGGNGNLGASKECQKCHDLTSQHLNTSDDTGLAGQRVKTNINGNSGLTTVTEACQACHTYENNYGPDTASNAAKVSSHGNSLDGGYTPQIEGPFATNCAQCHELHGNNLNSSDTTRNLKMIRADILISETTGTTGNVVFTSRTGTDSFDESDSTATEDNDDLCATCHSNADNPGNPMVRHTGGDHDVPDGLGSDQRGNDCAACHSHNYQDDASTTVSDGFMPLGACGDCHPAIVGDALFVTNGKGDTYGSHVTHFDIAETSSTWSLKGPGITVCDVCHGLDAGNHVGHMNGVVNFKDGATTKLVDTDACNDCHSQAGVFDGVTTGTADVGAKGYWISGVYDDTATLTSGNELWCAGCHDDAPSEMLVGTPTVSTMTAPNKIGDNATYGFYESGHGTTTTATYDSTTTGVNGGNNGAGKECAICHDLTTDHINTTDGTGTSGQRILDTINTQSVGGTLAGSCKTCHQNPGLDESTLTVSDHGNSAAEGYSPVEASMTVLPGCAACHEPHGDNVNTKGNRNLRMIRNDVLISATTGTTAPVLFERVSGTDSFDDNDGDDTNDICAACHVSSDNPPGDGMQRNTGGDHTDTVSASIFYNALSPDKRGDDCTACHRHDYKGGSVAPDNAFMPGFYGTFGIDNTCEVTNCHPDTTANQTSGSHGTHFTGNIGPGIGSCDDCHGANTFNGFQSGHDDTTVTFSNDTTIGATLACNTCHSPNGGYDGVDDTTYNVGAKTDPNWADGVYMAGGTTLTAGKEEWCVGCHDSDPSKIFVTDNTRSAPAVGGDASAYGYYVSGHGLDSGSQFDRDNIADGLGNFGAQKECQKCHDLTSQHLSSIDDTGLVNQRVKTDINGNSPLNTVTEACEACHTYENDNGPDTATAAVSTHGNADAGPGYDTQIESAFTVECAQCHELHGNNLNTDITRNLKMVRSDVLISETTGTTGNVVFTSTTGIKSFDTSDSTVTEDYDDICATCHANSDNPGYPVQRHTGGLHDGGGLGSDEREGNCTSCHSHNYADDSVTVADDGFMPLVGCGGCHPVLPSDPLWSTKGKGDKYGVHVTHFSYLSTGDDWSLKGPGIELCDVCHGAGSGSTAGDVGTSHHPGHQNEVVNFNESSTTVIGATTVCDDCHSKLGAFNGVDDTSYSIGAKDYWGDGVYSTTATLSAPNQWCAGCHDNAPSVISVATPTVSTMTAPSSAGDNVSYGFYESGHGTTTTATYDNTTTGVNGGNDGAGKECAICHDLTTDHINTTDGTGTSDQRILGTINTQPGIITIDDACNACHQNGGPDESTLTVSGHGNSTAEGYTAIEGAITEVPGCAACHELHGDNVNTNSNRNLRMIRNDVLISETTGTTAAVVFERTSGNDSLDADDGDDTNNLCVVCHASSDNPGFGMQRNVGGDHTDTVSASIFYNALTPNKRGEDCTACHRHEYKTGDVSSDDAFMPGFYETFGLNNTCDVTECHNATVANQTSGSHSTHFTSNKGPSSTSCNDCHSTATLGIGDHSGHDDTTVTFSSDTTIGATLACDTCHSPLGGYDGVNDTTIGVKKNNNWADGVYVPAGTTLTAGKEEWCVGCHDSEASEIKAPATSNTSMTAPAVGGDASLYGAYVSGHNTTTTVSYDATSIAGENGNSGAGLLCEDCHDLSTDAHLDNIDGTGTTGTNGQRIKSSINSTTTATLFAVCKACHGTTGGSSGSSITVSSHGNSEVTGYSRVETDAPVFTVECLQCHEPHGNNLIAGSRNLMMIGNDVLISETTGTTAPIVFKSTTGANSGDGDDGSDSDDICAACHANSDNPGTPMLRHDGGDHATADTGSIFEGETTTVSNKIGEDCTDCHKHDYLDDLDVSVDEGFMPGLNPIDGCVGGQSGCHATTVFDQTSGSHVTHFREQDTSETQSLKGPGIQTCDVCHPSGGASPGSHTGHIDGEVDFIGDVTLASTGACDSCHSPLGGYDGVDDTTYGVSGVGAKNNWTDGAYITTTTLRANVGDEWCAGCHDSDPSMIPVQGSPNDTMSAPAVGGDASAYGAFVSGHNATTAVTYDSTTTGVAAGGNPGAGKACADCHDLGSQHLNTDNDSDTTGQRILGTINGQSGIVTIDGACKACHQNSEGTQVSGHGNDADEGYAAIEESPMAVPGCAACHELHGNNLASGSRNLRMIRNDVLISETTGTTAPVVFKRTSGTNSFDANDGDDTDDICVACHANSDNPGEPMQRNVGGNHTDTVAASIFYQAPNADKRGEDCTACHRHDYTTGTVTPDDAFMPAFYATLEGTTTATCDVTDCHAANTTDQNTGSHVTHFSFGDTGNNKSKKGPALASCDDCHGSNADSGSHTGHDDGAKNFSDDTTLAATGVCDTCHSPLGGYNGVSDTTYNIGVKVDNNWTNGVYMGGGTTLTTGKEEWCVGCHDSDPSRIFVTDTTMSAPDIGGDNSEYGFYISGHGLNGTYGGDTTTDTATGNTGANKRCESCHDLASDTHLDNTDGTGTTGTNGQRIKSPINSLSVSTTADVCKNCHQVTTGSPATVTVSSHGNYQTDGYGPSIEDTFTVECGQCHDPHAAALNAEGRRNLRMVRPDVLISETTGTTGNVVFENTGDNATGTNSFDEKDIGETTSTGGNDDICTTCHVNSDNPGYPMTNHYGGKNHSGAVDNRGKLCTTCHNHAGFGSDYTIVDGFTPAGCDACHGQPPLSPLDTGGAVPPKENYEGGGGAHLRHQNSLDNLSGTDLCKRCHDDGSIGDGNHDELADGVPRRTYIDINFYSGIGNSTTALGYSLTSIDNSASISATATLPAATTTPTSCQVGCHNPGVFKPLGETTELMSNEATWTVRSIACVDCHDSQGAAIDATLSSTPIVQGVAQKSGHDRVDTSDATDPATGERINRRDCLRCHYSESGMASDDGTHTRGTVVVRNLQVSTGTPLIWDETSMTVQAGLCLGCHDSDGMPWSFSESGDDPIDIETSFTAAAHRTGGSSSATISLGCVGNADIVGGYGGCHGSPHGSGKRKLLAPTNVYGEDEQEVCLRCHNTTKIPTGKAGQIAEQMGYAFNSDQNYQAHNTADDVILSDSGSIFTPSEVIGQWFKYKIDEDYAWTLITGATATQLTLDATNDYVMSGGTSYGSGTEFYIQAKRVTHPVGVQHGKHDTTSETASSFGWNKNGQRHVTCEDCHNEHEGEPGTSTVGLAEIGAANKGVWGVTPAYETVYTDGGALFTDGNSSVTSATLDSATPNWFGKEGWRIKNNYDITGRWYTVQSITAQGEITLSENYDGTYTHASAMSGGNGGPVDYQMVKVTYTKTDAPTNQYELCLKCHSYFAYGAEIGAETGTDMQPNSPSGMYDINGDEVTVKETEIGADFAPTHLAIHPVMSLGKNQPIKVTGNVDTTDIAVNPNWPDYDVGTVAINTSGVATFAGGASIPSTVIPGWYLKWNDANPVTTAGDSDWYQVTKVNSATEVEVTPAPSLAQAAQAYSLTAGLGNNFVPPFGPWAYTTCSDCHRSGNPNNAKGPHGSNNKWQLVEATAVLSFDWFDGSSVVNVTPNDENVGATNNVATPFVFCYNCHRRDVYGDTGQATSVADNATLGMATATGYMARVPHDMSSNAKTFATGRGADVSWGNTGQFGIFCMKCHGGDSLGGLHGTSAGLTHVLLEEAMNDFNSTTAVGASPNLRGERFMNGATWHAVERATTSVGVKCWTKANDDEVNSCGQGHSPGIGDKVATYDY